MAGNVCLIEGLQYMHLTLKFESECTKSDALQRKLKEFDLDEFRKPFYACVYATQRRKC